MPSNLKNPGAQLPGFFEASIYKAIADFISFPAPRSCLPCRR
jgi:hypothetical protein